MPIAPLGRHQDHVAGARRAAGPPDQLERTATASCQCCGGHRTVRCAGRPSVSARRTSLRSHQAGLSDRALRRTGSQDTGRCRRLRSASMASVRAREPRPLRVTVCLPHATSNSKQCSERSLSLGASRSRSRSPMVCATVSPRSRQGTRRGYRPSPLAALCPARLPARPRSSRPHRPRSG